MKWDKGKKSYKKGGLGIRSLVEMNAALQGKCLWTFLKEEGRLWRRIIEVRWGVLERWGDAGQRRGHGVCLW